MPDSTMTEAAQAGESGAAAREEERPAKAEQQTALGTSAGDPNASTDNTRVPPGALTRTQLDTLKHQIAAFSHICNQNLLLTQQRAEQAKPGAAAQHARAAQYGQSNVTLAAIASSIGVAVTQSTSSQPAYPAPIYSKDNKTPSAPRWNPTPAQLARLEELFATGMGTPNGDLRTQITEELAKLGQINEANVYNWFQNKKARMKKRLQEEAAAAVVGQ